MDNMRRQQEMLRQQQEILRQQEQVRLLQEQQRRQQDERRKQEEGQRRRRQVEETRLNDSRRGVEEQLAQGRERLKGVRRKQDPPPRQASAADVGRLRAEEIMKRLRNRQPPR